MNVQEEYGMTEQLQNRRLFHFFQVTIGGRQEKVVILRKVVCVSVCVRVRE